MVKKQTKSETKKQGFFSKAGSFLSIGWFYVSTGRDYFWKGIRWTLATSIFLLIAVIILYSILKPIWTFEEELDPTGKVVVFSPSGLVVDQAPTPAEQNQLNIALGLEAEMPNIFEYRKLMQFFEDFKNDDRVSGMIFDPTGMSIASSYAINLANLIKDVVDSGKEVVVRGVYWNDTSYLIASGASEISARVIGGLPDNNFNINGFGGSSLYLKDFFEKFLITPRIVVGGEFKTGPETFLRSDMSDEQKSNLYYINEMWQKYKDIVQANRSVDLQDYADNLYRNLIDGEYSFEEIPLEFGLVDALEARDEFDERMLNKFGAREDNEERLNAIYYRDYLTTLEAPKKSKSKNVIRVITLEGTIQPGDITLGSAGSTGIVKMFRDAHEDKNTKGIVFRVNSGGGASISSELMRKEINKALDKGIAVVTSMGAVAASGGYDVASPTDKIFLDEHGITGSIGAFALGVSFEKVFDWLGINPDGYSTTKYGAVDLSSQEWPQEIIDYRQAWIEDGYRIFKETVSKERSIPIEIVDNIAQGKVYTANDALEIGLIDEIGNLEAAIEYTATERLALEEYRVVYVKPPKPSADLSFNFLEFAQNSFERLILQRANSLPFEGLESEVMYKYCLHCSITD